MSETEPYRKAAANETDFSPFHITHNQFTKCEYKNIVQLSIQNLIYNTYDSCPYKHVFKFVHHFLLKLSNNTFSQIRKRNVVGWTPVRTIHLHMIFIISSAVALNRHHYD